MCIISKLSELEKEKAHLEKTKMFQNKMNAQLPDITTIYSSVLDNLTEKIKSRTDKIRPAFDEYLGAVPLTIENNSVYAHIRTSASKLLTKQQYLAVVARARNHARRQRKKIVTMCFCGTSKKNTIIIISHLNLIVDKLL